MNDVPPRPATPTKYVRVSLNLVASPTPEAIGAAIDSVQGAFDHYPRGQVLMPQPVVLTSTGAVAQLPANPNEPAGFQFDYVMPDGVPTRLFACSDNTVQFARTPPQRMSDITADALSEFSVVLPHLAQPVVGVGLERLDRFLWEGPRSEFRARAILCEGSDWLTPKVFQAPDLWHSYHGLFEYLNEPCPHRLLHVLEASARSGRDADPPEPNATSVIVDIRQQLRIAHAMTSADSAAEPVVPSALLAAEAEGPPCLLMRYMEHLIIISNAVLRATLSADTLETIAPEQRP